MATSIIPNYLKVRRTKSTLYTNANGFINTVGIINAQKQVPLQAYVYSASYPNGLIGTLLCTGSSQSGNYWIKVTDSGAGTAITNTPVEATVHYVEI